MNIQECFCSRSISLFYSVLKILVEKRDNNHVFNIENLNNYFMLKEEDEFNLSFIHNTLSLLNEDIGEKNKLSLINVFEGMLSTNDVEKIKKFKENSVELENYRLYLDTIKRLLRFVLNH